MINRRGPPRNAWTLPAGGTAVALAVVAACSLPPSEISEIDAYERAVRAQTKDDARAFIDTFQTSHLTGDLIESLHPQVALEVCADLPAGATRAAGPCEELRQLAAIAPAAARPMPTAPSRPARAAAAAPTPPSAQAAVAGPEPAETPGAAPPEPEPAAIRTAVASPARIEAVTTEPIEVEVLAAAAKPAAVRPLMIAPEPVTTPAAPPESTQAPDEAATRIAAPTDVDKLQIEASPSDAESTADAGDIAGPAVESALANAKPEEPPSPAAASAAGPRMVQVVEANKGGSTADWLVPAGVSAGADDDVESDDDGFARGKAAAKRQAKEEDKAKTKTKDVGKTQTAAPAVGKDKDNGSGLSNADAQRGKDKDMDGGGGGGTGEGGRDGKN